MISHSGKPDSLRALEGATLHTAPFPFLIADRFFSEEEAAALRQWFERDARWWLQLRDFYTHDTCENMHECPLTFAGGPLARQERAAIADFLADRFGVELERDNVTLAAHRMKPGGGIGIHTDNPALGTESVRLLVTLGNEAYEDRHGGHLCLFRAPHQEDLTTVVRPTHNAAVAFALSDRSYHAVNDVTEGVRYSLVYGFWAKGMTIERTAARPRRRPHRAPEDVASRLSDGRSIVGFLSDAGASGIAHSDARLLDHLLGVAAILLDWDAGETIARAGLYHSVYGTATFDQPLFSDAGRPAVRAVIGERAEALVWLFCNVQFSEVYRYSGEREYLARRRGDAAPLRLTEEDVRDLNLIAAANLVEQLPVYPLGPGDLFEWRNILNRLGGAFPPKARAALEAILNC
jgi:hypothetical protein